MEVRQHCGISHPTHLYVGQEARTQVVRLTQQAALTSEPSLWPASTVSTFHSVTDASESFCICLGAAVWLGLRATAALVLPLGGLWSNDIFKI